MKQKTLLSNYDLFVKKLEDEGRVSMMDENEAIELDHYIRSEIKEFNREKQLKVASSELQAAKVIVGYRY